MNIFHDKSGAHDPLPPVTPPGSTPLRQLARAVADALSLPPPRAEHDEHLRAGVLDQRSRIVASVCRRLADDVEADALDVVMAASSIRDRTADFEVNYSVNPLSS
jgi:hypothetical protein